MQGLWFKNEVEGKTWECPSKMYMTGVEVKRGRREIGDRDTYDFKLQCSGVWQSFMGMKFGGLQEAAQKECPTGDGSSGIKVYRGFIDWGVCCSVDCCFCCNIPFDIWRRFGQNLHMSVRQNGASLAISSPRCSR